jgi:hypothetical protein
VGRLVKFRKETERFWIDGVFKDDIGLKVDGAFGKAYQTANEVAVMIANLSDKPSIAHFEIDRRLHNIEGDSFSVVSSTGENSKRDADKLNGTLKESLTLGSYEVIAAIFPRHSSQA